MVSSSKALVFWGGFSGFFVGELKDLGLGFRAFGLGVLGFKGFRV